MAFVAAVVAAMGALKTADTEKKVGDYNAKIGEQNAVVARDQASAEMKRQNRAARKMLGSIRAGYGASGVSVEGSPLDVLAESAADAELDSQTLKYRGEVKARGLEAGAALDRYEGNEAQRAGYTKAAGTLLNSYGSKGMPSWFGGTKA